MRTRGLGLRRYAAVAAIVLAMCAAAPALAAPAGATALRSTGRAELQSRPAARSARPAKHRRHKVRRTKRLRPISAAKKRALLERYIKSHPGVVAAHARRPNVTLAKKLKAAAYLRAHPRRKVKKRVAVAAPRRPRRAPVKKKAASGKAKKNKKKKAAAVSGWRRDAMLLGGLAVAALAVFLIGSSVFSGPRSRARARARRRQRALAPR
jgi:hypothetical protein